MRVPADLQYLRDAVRFFLGMVADIAPTLDETPTYAGLAKHLAGAQDADAVGTPAAIGAELDRLLGLSS